MARPGPRLTDTERDRIRALHAAGYSRNAICRELGRSAGAITEFCQAEGLSFDRASTAAATRARKVDAAQLRAELELQLLEDAQRLRAQVWQEHEYREYGGKEFILRKWKAPEPTPTDKLRLMQAAGQAIDRSIRLAEVDKGGEVDAARSMLGKLLEQLGVVAGDYDEAISR